MDVLHKIEETVSEIGLRINAKKTEYIAINIQNNTFEIRDRNCDLLKVVGDLKYFGNYIAKIERDVEKRIGKAWGA